MVQDVDKVKDHVTQQLRKVDMVRIAGWIGYSLDNDDDVATAKLIHVVNIRVRTKPNQRITILEDFPASLPPTPRGSSGYSSPSDGQTYTRIQARSSFSGSENGNSFSSPENPIALNGVENPNPSNDNNNGDVVNPDASNDDVNNENNDDVNNENVDDDHFFEDY